MNAVGRRGIRVVLLISSVCAYSAPSVQCGEFKSQLVEEIERRFPDNPHSIDLAPLEFGFAFSRYATIRIGCCSSAEDIVRKSGGITRLEHLEVTPEPSPVEQLIAKGFPSGEPAKLDDAPVDGHSHLLAEEDRMLGQTSFDY